MVHKRLMAVVLVVAATVAGCGAGDRKGDFSAPWRPVELGGEEAAAMPPVYVPPAGDAAAAPDTQPAASELQVATVTPPAVSEDPPVAVSAPQPAAAPSRPAPPAPTPAAPAPAPRPTPAPAPQTPAPSTPAPKPDPVPVTPSPVMPPPVVRDPQPEPPDASPDLPAPDPQEPEPEPEMPAPEPPGQEPPASEPAPAPVPAGLTGDEALMVRLVNEERAKAGLEPLEVDMQVVQTARVKSQDMVTHNYFSHDSARLGSPFDQMKAAGIRYRTAGENIAGNPSVEGAHRSLMNSSGHRANILSRSFKKIGVGIIRGGRYGMMFTQQFIG